MADLTFNLTSTVYFNYPQQKYETGTWAITTNGEQGNLYDGNGNVIGHTGQTFDIEINRSYYEIFSTIAYGATPADSVVIFKDCKWRLGGTVNEEQYAELYGKYRNLTTFESFEKDGPKASGNFTATITAIATHTPTPASVNLTLKNNSATQQIKYKVGAGAETTINAGAQVSISNLANNTVLGINPILTPRPIHFTSNGRIQKITYNAIDYNVFPTDINVDVSGTPTLDITGNPAPEVTVNYTNTNEPVITDT